MFIDLKKRKSDYIIGKIINKAAYFLIRESDKDFLGACLSACRTILCRHYQTQCF